MTRLVPIGFLTFREAVARIEETMFAGIPDSKGVMEAREREQGDVGDRDANRKAGAELWKAVDGGRVRPLAIGGARRRIIKLDPALTSQIPHLRLTGDFSYLRQNNPAFKEFTSWFPSRTTAAITLGFRENDIEKLCSKLRQRRRRTVLRPGEQTKRGRPSLARLVRPAVVELIENNGWSTAHSLKALVRAVERRTGKWVSEETAGRCLDELFKESRDRKYLRRKKVSAHQSRPPNLAQPG
jgi:hypothetical protein